MRMVLRQLSSSFLIFQRRTLMMKMKKELRRSQKAKDLLWEVGLVELQRT